MKLAYLLGLAMLVCCGGTAASPAGGGPEVQVSADSEVGNDGEVTESASEDCLAETADISNLYADVACPTPGMEACTTIDSTVARMKCANGSWVVLAVCSPSCYCVEFLCPDGTTMCSKCVPVP